MHEQDNIDISEHSYPVNMTMTIWRAYMEDEWELTESPDVFPGATDIFSIVFIASVWSGLSSILIGRIYSHAKETAASSGVLSNQGLIFCHRFSP